MSLLKYPSVVENSLRKQYPGHSSHVTKVKFSFDDCFIVSTGGNDKAVVIWETDFGIGDQNQGEKQDFPLNSASDDLVEEEVDKREFIQRKKKIVGAEKYKQYKEGYVSQDSTFNKKPTEKKPEDDLFGEEEDKGDESMTIKPWMGAIKEPSGYIKPALNQEKPPLISLELTHVYGYRSKDCRNNLKYLKSGHIAYFAAALGIVLDPAANKQRFFQMHNDDITAMAIHPDGILVATGEAGPKAWIFVWDSNTMQKVCEFKGCLSKGISALAFNSNGEKLVGACLNDSNSIAIFDVKVPNGALLAVSASGKEIISDICFRNENEFAEVGPNHLRFWGFANKSLSSKSSQIPNSVSKILVCVKYNSDDCIIGDSLGNLQVWKEGVMIGYYKLHEGGIDALGAHGNYVLTGGKDSLIKILDKNYTPLIVYMAEQNIKFSLSPMIRALCFSSDYKSILIGTYGSEIYEIQTK